MPRGRPAIKPQPEYGAHLARLREDAGLTQKELAQKMNVPISNITFWERSDMPPRSEVLTEMAKALGVTVDIILRNKPLKPKPSVAKGRLQILFKEASQLSRRQQDKIADVIRALVTQCRSERAEKTNGHAKAA